MAEEKIALLFPGQGTHYVGMGRDLYDKHPAIRNVYDKAAEILDIRARVMSLGKLQHFGFKRTDYVQIGVFVANHAMYELFRSRYPDLRYHATAGHSLGEYNALVASGAISFELALPLVQKRGKHMHDSSNKTNGGLVALIAKSHTDLGKQLSELEARKVYPALYNSPGSITIGGRKESLDSAVAELEEKGIRAVKVNVEGPFHTLYMKDAADMLRKDINSTRFNFAAVPIVANSSARFILDPMDIEQELYAQVYSPVMWADSIKRMRESGIDFFIVIGLDKDEFIKKTVGRVDKDVRVMTVMDIPSLYNVAIMLNSKNPRK